MPKDNLKIATGLVLEALPSANFKVRLDNEEEMILAHLSGKMRLNHIKVVVGDKVKIEISQYGTTRGRIVQRL